MKKKDPSKQKIESNAKNNYLGFVKEFSIKFRFDL